MGPTWKKICHSYHYYEHGNDRGRDWYYQEGSLTFSLSVVTTVPDIQALSQGHVEKRSQERYNYFTASAIIYCRHSPTIFLWQVWCEQKVNTAPYGQLPTSSFEDQLHFSNVLTVQELKNC